MRIEENEGLTITTTNYRLRFAKDRPFVLVCDGQEKKLLDLFTLSAVHTLQGRDDTVKTGDWLVRTEGTEILVTMVAESSLWRKKVYCWRCQEERFRYEVEVEGEGELAEANFFGGYYSANPRWGSGFFSSGHNFKRGFNPEPNTNEEWYFGPREGSVIDLMGVPLPGKGDWFFTPPPFCFVLEGANGWIALGVEAEPGANRFTEFNYHGQFGFYLSLSYEGHTRVAGRYRLPAIGFEFASDEYGALAAHVHTLATRGYVNLYHGQNAANWWQQPIFCGWGAQCYAATVGGGKAPDYARQSQYEAFLATLRAHDVSPGIIVIDDKWQAKYGNNKVDEEKWPDLPGFITRQHEEGKKVLLWLKAWDPEGLPVAECIRNGVGLPIALDPSNPACADRIRVSVRRMLSTDGYDADGFKIDFSARIPSGPGHQIYGDIWGLELMKLFLKVIYDEAKKTKPDALIITHTPHPYLAEVVDMIRLNDINIGTDVNRAMIHRANVARIACPQALIDTDNWPMTDKKTWRAYLKLQPELGVPACYLVSHVDTTREPLTAEDYQLLKESWQKYLESTRSVGS